MTRGGYWPVFSVVLLNGDHFPALSLAALGAWVRIRSIEELNEGPASPDQVARLNLPRDVAEELLTSGVVVEDVGGWRTDAMPPVHRKPSDEPAAIRERVARHREKASREREAEREVKSSLVKSNAVTRYGVLPSVKGGVTAPDRENVHERRPVPKRATWSKHADGLYGPDEAVEVSEADQMGGEG